MRATRYHQLAWLVEQRPTSGPPLLVLAVRYFFRRGVEANPELARGLTLTHLEGLSQQLQQGLLCLDAALTRQEAKLRALLEDVRSSVEGALDRQSQQIRELTQAVREALDRHHLNRGELCPRDSLSIHSDAERQAVRRLLEQYRQLPWEQQDRLPALLSGLSKLRVATGQFAEARKGFARVAEVARDAKERAEAHHNAYRAAVEARDWQTAMKHIISAADLDPHRFTPFPSARYKPERILGAGGFGVAFLCTHRYMKVSVVVKSLLVDDLGRDVENVFAEAQVVTELDDPVLVRFWDCGYMSAKTKSRPYLVMDYFDGIPLDQYVRSQGRISPNDLKAVMRPVAEGLQAAHAKGIYHRDVKPANILVRREESRWRVKLIDFGLAWKQSVLDRTAASTAVAERTIAGASIAGTLEYAAPEQLGKSPGVNLGPHSDVYGFGKTCYFALLGTPEPDDQQKASLPLGWRRLLSDCTAYMPNRLPDFGAVLRRLVKLKASRAGLPVRPRQREAADRDLPPRVACPQCGTALRVSQVSVGQTLRCGACSNRFVIRHPEDRLAPRRDGSAHVQVDPFADS